MKKYHHGNLRAALLERACEIIETHGIEALSLRALARDLNVSSAAPSRHFGSRHDLLQAIAKEGYKQLTQTTINAMETCHPNAMHRSNTMAKAFVNWAQDNRAFYIAIIHPDVTRHADQDLQIALGDFAKVIQAILKEAQASGWRPQDHPDVLFHYVTSLIRGLCENLIDRLYISAMGPIDAAHIAQIIDQTFPLPPTPKA